MELAQQPFEGKNMSFHGHALMAITKDKDKKLSVDRKFVFLVTTYRCKACNYIEFYDCGKP